MPSGAPTASRRRSFFQGRPSGCPGGLLKGKTVGIDSTTPEASAVLRSIVRRDTGAGYDAFLRGLGAASGIPTPTRTDLACLDRKRRKKGSNKDWTHPRSSDTPTAA